MSDTSAKEYRSVFRTHQECGSSLGSFRFDKPEGYLFAAGQHAMLTLPTREGLQSKPFTSSQAPSDPYIEVTTRLSGSAFKDALLSLAPGDIVDLSGPHGRMIVPEAAKKVAFLVGGVGSTPARSIVRDAVQRGTGLVVELFYGNQDLTCVPFREEFAQYEATHPEIKVVDVLAEPPDGWEGETGFITAEVVRRYVDPLDEWHFVVAGPPSMIDPMKRVLAELEMPGDRVTLDVFTGYQ